MNRPACATRRPISLFIPDVFPCNGYGRRVIALDGMWEFRRDPDGRGIEEHWQSGQRIFSDTMRIPGAPQAQGFGKPTQVQKTFFISPFWIRREFRLPRCKPDARVWLRLGCVLPAAEIYVNGTLLGYTKSSRTPQRADITQLVRPGQANLLAIQVCDFPKVRMDGLWEWAEGMKNWTGMYTPTSIEITGNVSILDYYARPCLSESSLFVKTEVSGPTTDAMELIARILDGRRVCAESVVPLPAGRTYMESRLKLREFLTWSPNHPKLYRLELALRHPDTGTSTDTVRLRFGMREIAFDGPKLLLNGSPIYLRCYGDNQYYPETLAPPADKNWFLPRLKRARRFGMNAVKACVDTIPPAYLDAADEAGILVIHEMPFGLGGDLRANRYTIDREYREYYAQELDGIVKVSRNHACVVCFSMSSELESDKQTPESFRYFSHDLVRRTRRLAPHALVVDCTGHTLPAAEETPKGKRDTDLYVHVIPTWMKEVLIEPPIATDGRHPVILHEYNWWSCYPDPRDRSKYRRGQFKPFWFDQLLKSAREQGQAHLVPGYHRNSMRLQALGRKDGMEYARRNPVIEGYILWLLIDFGQYSEGLLDDFWNPKNVSSQEFLKSNADTIILLGKEGDRCLKAGTTVTIPFAVSHYGEEFLRNGRIEWKTQAAGRMLSGTIPIRNLAGGKTATVGVAALELPLAHKAYKLELQAVLRGGATIVNTNHWSFWAFPEVGRRMREAIAGESDQAAAGVCLRLGAWAAKPIPDDAALVVAEMADADLRRFVERGGRCLLALDHTHAPILNKTPYYGSQTFMNTFRTIPWNAGTSGNSGTVIGAHPALAAFPHGAMCDLQFVTMIRGIFPMDFDPLRRYGVAPIIRVIGHYRSNRNNAYLIEFNVGKGKILATTLGLVGQWQNHIEARALFNGLVEYALSDKFKPTANVPSDVFRRLFSYSTSTDITRST